MNIDLTKLSKYFPILSYGHIITYYSNIDFIIIYYKINVNNYLHNKLKEHMNVIFMFEKKI